MNKEELELLKSLGFEKTCIESLWDNKHINLHGLPSGYIKILPDINIAVQIYLAGRKVGRIEKQNAIKKELGL